ncbi:MAG: BrnT family toxin [Pseudomonadota bacterium]
MKLDGIIWLRDIEEKLTLKHHVEVNEVEEVLKNKPTFRFVEKGEQKEEDVYMALGQTYAGRYLTVLFIYKKTKEALILSARNMAKKREEEIWQKVNLSMTHSMN